MSRTHRGRQYNKLYFQGANALAGQAETRSSNLDLQLHCPKKTHSLYIQFIFAYKVRE